MSNNLSRILENKYFDLNKAVDRSYMSNGVACLAVKIKSYDDVISRYSGDGYECLNHEFFSYLDRNIRYIPEDVPILLQVYGCELPDEHKEIIAYNIREHYLYKLGEVIEENSARVKKMIIFLVFSIVFLALSILTEEKYAMLSSFLNLAFWFYGSAVVTFLAVEIAGNRKKRTRAAQIANMYITIEKEYNDAPITEEDKKIIIDFIKKANEKEKHLKS